MNRGADLTLANYREISGCRLCGGTSLISVLDLGNSCLTGVFPWPTEEVGMAPLELVWCADCHLVQLRHSHNPLEMYGKNYGYRSGLNASMVSHLQNKVRRLETLVKLDRGDVVLDIGCNDGTLLGGYETNGLRRVGIDPTASKFAEWHPSGIEVSSTFFSSEEFHKMSKERARIVTSIAMFYDLESPQEFASDVASILADDGIWHFEQSYMPSMLRAGSYDTVCHEHLEYYSLRNVLRVLRDGGLKPLAVRFNSVNGGSFAVTAAHESSKQSPADEALVEWLVEQEDRMGLGTPTPFRDFETRVYRHRKDLRTLIERLNASGSRILGYGASTKGNVMLQFCGITSDLLPGIGEVNPDKYGRVAPGSRIPIISEEEMHAAHPDYLLVLPWHFREAIVRRETEFLRNGGRLIFPLPEIEIVGD